MKRRRILPLLLAAVLFLGLARPMPVSAASLYFTGVNDSVVRSEERRVGKECM